MITSFVFAVRGVPGKDSLSDRFSPKTLRVFFVAFPFFILVSTTVLLWFWQSKSVRKLALDYAAQYRPRLLEAALDDPSFEIRNTACQHLIDSGTSLRSEVLLDALMRDPKLTGACLGGVERRQRKNERPIERNYVSHHKVLAYRVSEDWFDAMIGRGDGPPVDPCQSAKLLKPLSQLAPVRWRRKLFLATFLGESDKARSCALETFGGKKALVEALDSRRVLDRESFDEYMVPLVAVSYREHVSSDESNDLPTHGVEDLPEGLEPVRVRDWVVERACGLLERGFDPHRMVVRSFKPIFEGETCEVDGKPPQSYYETATWRSFCADSYSYHRQHELQEPTDAMCNGLEYASVGRAVEAAADQVFLARRQRQKVGVLARDSSISIMGPSPEELSAPSWVLENRRQQTSQTPLLKNFAQGLMSGQ